MPTRFEQDLYMVPDAEPLPEELRGHAFSVARAHATGVGTGRLRRSDLAIPRRGVRVPAGTDLTAHDLARYVISKYPDAIISHLSAARFWGFPLPGGRDDEDTTGLHIPLRHRTGMPHPGSVDAGASPGSGPVPDLYVTLPSGVAPPRWEGVRARNSPITVQDIVLVDGIRMTSRVRTWFDLMAELDHPWGVVIADHLLREPRSYYEDRHCPFATIEELEHFVEQRRRTRGRPAAVRALGHARVGADSPQETRLRLALIEAGIPEPLLNQRIRDENGTEHHQPDMQWPRWKVCVEYEGASHRAGVQIERDIDRAERAVDLEWDEVRITSRDATNGWSRAIHRIRTALRKAGWPSR